MRLPSTLTFTASGSPAGLANVKVSDCSHSSDRRSALRYRSASMIRQLNAHFTIPRHAATYASFTASGKTPVFAGCQLPLNSPQPGRLLPLLWWKNPRSTLIKPACCQWFTLQIAIDKADLPLKFFRVLSSGLINRLLLPASLHLSRLPVRRSAGYQDVASIHIAVELEFLQGRTQRIFSGVSSK